MNAASASLLNGLVLLLVGLWGSYETGWAPTSFIPVVAGVIILALNGGVKKENKVIAHVAVVLTLLIGLALIMPLMKSLDREGLGTIRIVIMMLSCLIAMIYFIKSFKAARIARESASEKQ